jgi:tripartite-type tricarboxylate transporter receptor subunit TctC
VISLSASAMTNIIGLCADADAAAAEWGGVWDALQRLRRAEAAGVPANPHALVSVANKAAAIGKLGISAVRYCIFSNML